MSRAYGSNHPKRFTGWTEVHPYKMNRAYGSVKVEQFIFLLSVRCTDLKISFNRQILYPDILKLNNRTMTQETDMA